MLTSPLQLGVAAPNPSGAAGAPAKALNPGPSRFAQSLLQAGNRSAAAITKPQSRQGGASVNTKAMNSTPARNATAASVKKLAPSPAMAFAIPEPIVMPIAVAAAPTTAAMTLPAADGGLEASAGVANDPGAQVFNATEAAPLSNAAITETAASQGRWDLRATGRSDSQPANAPQDVKPAAISDVAQVAEPAGPPLLSFNALFSGTDSVLVSNLPAQADAPGASTPPNPSPADAGVTDAASKTNPSPSLQLAMPPYDPSPVAGATKSSASVAAPLMATPFLGRAPLGLAMHTAVPSAAKPADPPLAMKANSTHQSPSAPVVATTRVQAADNSTRAFRNPQADSSPDNSLAMMKRSSVAPAEIRIQPGSTDPAAVSGSPPPSGNNPADGSNHPAVTSDPSIVLAATANVLSQLPAPGDQSVAALSSSALNRSASSTTAASPSSAELSVPVASPVQVARMVENTVQSEMHIGLRTQDFGSVEVHTVVRDMQVGLAVGSEKGDLRGFLASEMPGLQASLRQQDLRFDHIRFLEPGGPNTGFSGGDHSQSRSSSQRHSSNPGFSVPATEPVNSVLSDVALAPKAGLNVHA